MDLQLSGRVVLVVGGHGYIGSAVVARLVDEGAIAIPASRHAETGIRMDAHVDASVAAAVDTVLAEHGRLDGLVVSAAPSARTLDRSRDGQPDQVLQAIDDKVMTFLRLARAALAIMQPAGFGRIVGISGQNAFQTGNITGSIRNAALIVAAKNLADEVAGTGVTVNTVSPGIVVAEPGTDIPLGRSGQTTPQQVGDLVAFLVSPLTASISGESIAAGHRLRGAVQF